MTQPETMSVEYEELISRAAELETPLLGQPKEDALAPCCLAFSTNAANRLKSSADSMRFYLDAGQRERNALAQSLRNAAKAYEETDQNAADTLSDGAPRCRRRHPPPESPPWQ
jgi:hypothetical protein